MLYHCDALLPLPDRYLSPKFRQLSRSFWPYRLDRVLLLELAILLNTPGFYPLHVAHMLQWDRNILPRYGHHIATHYREEALEYVPANLSSIVLSDGRATLRAILDGHAHYGGTMPLYVTRYLQHRRDAGATSRVLAREFGTTPARIQRWWTADLFDPLTGAARPEHLLHKHKPLARIRRVI